MGFKEGLLAAGTVLLGIKPKFKNAVATEFAEGLDISWLLDVAKKTKELGEQTAATDKDKDCYMATCYTKTHNGMTFTLESSYNLTHTEDGNDLIAVINEIIVKGSKKELDKIIKSYLSYHNLMSVSINHDKKKGEARLFETMYDETDGYANAETAASRQADFLLFFGLAADDSWEKGETNIEFNDPVC